jgi:hypothetical protein
MCTQCIKLLVLSVLRKIKHVKEVMMVGRYFFKYGDQEASLRSYEQRPI